MKIAAFFVIHSQTLDALREARLPQNVQLHAFVLLALSHASKAAAQRALNAQNHRSPPATKVIISHTVPGQPFRSQKTASADTTPAIKEFAYQRLSRESCFLNLQPLALALK